MNLVDRGRALAYKGLTRPMQVQKRLLLGSLDRHKAHGWADAVSQFAKEPVVQAGCGGGRLNAFFDFIGCCHSLAICRKVGAQPT
ncbi:hypothetical protein CBM2609_B30249 [Cupriavidus taiwanensis]|nr:hypothetical protein CBM2604_B40248 [Cupriavidus taiwanensis]SOZ32568.1 hypothetical protein CBM2609_B30249 [Cupriavidus taiwanensis]SOZ48167.1 hypothetical protein CBM2610_B30248 [Cupriavidus taiwanensis]